MNHFQQNEGVFKQDVWQVFSNNVVARIDGSTLASIVAAPPVSAQSPLSSEYRGTSLIRNRTPPRTTTGPWAQPYYMVLGSGDFLCIHDSRAGSNEGCSLESTSRNPTVSGSETSFDGQSLSVRQDMVSDIEFCK